MLPKNCFVIVRGPFAQPMFMTLEEGLVLTSFTGDKSQAILFGDRRSAERMAVAYECVPDVRIEELWLTEHNARAKPLVWMYHPESESVLSGEEYDNGDGCVELGDVVSCLKKVAAGWSISNEDILLLLADRDRMISDGSFQKMLIERSW